MSESGWCRVKNGEENRKRRTTVQVIVSTIRGSTGDLDCTQNWQGPQVTGTRSAYTVLQAGTMLIKIIIMVFKYFKY